MLSCDRVKSAPAARDNLLDKLALIGFRVTPHGKSIAGRAGKRLRYLPVENQALPFVQQFAHG